MQIIKSERQAIAPLSKEAYRQADKDLAKFLEARGLALSYESINEYLNDLKARWSASTFNLRAQGIKDAMLKRAETPEQRFLVKDFFSENVRRVKISKRISRDQYLTREEIDRLKLNAPRKVALMVEALFVTGCRISGLLGIRFIDAEIHKGLVSIKVTEKGSKTRTVYMPENLFNDLKTFFGGSVYLLEERGKQLERTAVSKLITAAGKKNGLKISAHTLRHSCAMHLLSSGRSAKYVSEYLGHADVAITLAFYVHENVDSSITKFF